MRRTTLSTDEMLRACRRRDTSYDGLFFVCVRSTGVFCRPSCRSRQPRTANMVFHPAVESCLREGFRPCKRCRPLAASPEDASWLDPLLARIERDPGARLRDRDIAALRLSPIRVRRYFRRNFAMTFQAYHRARRVGVALQSLRAGRDTVRAALDHGYHTPGGLREALRRVAGDAADEPTRAVLIRTARVETPLGPMTAAATDDGVGLLEFADAAGLDGQLESLRSRIGGAVVPGRCPHLDALKRELAEYFAGRRRGFDVPLKTVGTPFEELVWAALRGIPFGETRSYSEIARQVGRPGAQRAVGLANGRNRIAILIPCHRVIRGDGSLGGYGGGLRRKEFLLNLERRATPS